MTLSVDPGVPAPVLLFSRAQLHSSIPNTSGRARFSVDFRTVDVVEMSAGSGAPLVDADCTRIDIRDFRRLAPSGSMLVLAQPAKDELDV